VISVKWSNSNSAACTRGNGIRRCLFCFCGKAAIETTEILSEARPDKGYEAFRTIFSYNTHTHGIDLYRGTTTFIEVVSA